MAGFDLTVSDSANAALDARLTGGLTEHAEPFVEGPGFRPLAVLAHDESGDLVGAVTGKVNWNWLHIKLLWVEHAARGRGLGSRLLSALEQEARERGCTMAHLDTFSYQARPFYERHGYGEFGRLEDYPPGHVRFFMRKCL